MTIHKYKNLYPELNLLKTMIPDLSGKVNQQNLDGVLQYPLHSKIQLQ